MKKILLSLTVMTVIPCVSMAYLSETETNQIETLKAQGYSTPTLQLMDTVNYQNKGINGNYEKKFKNHRADGKIGWYQRLKEYVDPAQDDGHFGEHDVTFSNNWRQDNVKYSSPMIQNENL